MSIELIIALIGGILLQAAFLYLIISAATKAEKRARYDWAQTQFLAYIARQQGMPEDQVNDILRHL
jgi:hypothetical protein